MVGGQIVGSTPIHEKSHRNIYDTMKSGHIHGLIQAKIKYQKLNRGRTGGHRWCDGTSAVEQTFFGCTRISWSNNDNVPRQQKYNTTGRKCKIFKLKVNPPHKRKVFTNSRKAKKGKVKVAFCPTTNMLGDFFMKPLQGSTFKRMWSIILNIPDTDKSSSEHRSALDNKRISTEK